MFASAWVVYYEGSAGVPWAFVPGRFFVTYNEGDVNMKDSWAVFSSAWIQGIIVERQAVLGLRLRMRMRMRSPVTTAADRDVRGIPQCCCQG